VADAIAKGRLCRSISGMAGSFIVVVIAFIYDFLPHFSFKKKIFLLWFSVLKSLKATKNRQQFSCSLRHNHYFKFQG